MTNPQNAFGILRGGEKWAASAENRLRLIALGSTGFKQAVSDRLLQSKDHSKFKYSKTLYQIVLVGKYSASWRQLSRPAGPYKKDL